MESTKILTLIIIALCLYSCTEEYQPVSEDKQDTAVIIAELEVGKDVSLTISSTFGEDSAAMFPTDQDGSALLSNPENGQFNKELRWVDNEAFRKKWIQTSFKFFEGQEIILDTDFSSVGLSKTYATAVVPPKGTIINEPETTEIIVDDINTYELNLNLAELPENIFYHLKAYILENGRKTFLKTKEIKNGNAASFQLTHMDGMLIDYKQLDNSGNLHYVVQSNNLLNTNPSSIYLLVKTVPEAYYKFQKSLTIQKETQQGPFDAPVPTFTNIEGGQGIFVAYQSALETIPVR